jgi:diguanylate cyclase (GGDEF)-like protein
VIARSKHEYALIYEAYARVNLLQTLGSYNFRIRKKAVAMKAPTMPDEAARQAELDSHRITDTDRDESFDRITRLASATAQTPVATITFLDNDRQWFKSKVGLDDSETPRDQAFCDYAIQDDEVMIVEDASIDPRFSDNPLVTKEGGIRFYVGAPLRMKSGHRLGTLCVIDHKPRSIEPHTVSLLKDMAAMVVSEMELRKAAGTDALTGLFNRRFTDEMAQREMTRARRMCEPLTVAIIDADHFKSVNDTFGHSAGDAVLRALSSAFKDVVRQHDVVGRYGGEEFLVIMPNTSLTQARSVLDRLRIKIFGLNVPDLTDHRRVTVSIGASEVEEADTNIGAAIARADAALYRAKETGRNRVELAAA